MDRRDCMSDIEGEMGDDVMRQTSSTMSNTTEAAS